MGVNDSSSNFKEMTYSHLSIAISEMMQCGVIYIVDNYVIFTYRHYNMYIFFCLILKYVKYLLKMLQNFKSLKYLQSNKFKTKKVVI